MQFGTSISFFHVRSATAVSAEISIPAYAVYRGYTDHAGPEISVNSRIASAFSRKIANGNAGPTTALDSMGPKATFHCHFLNIGASYKQ